MTSDSGSKEVRLILLERLPATCLLMGTSELSLFFVSVFLALSLSRRYGSLWDKLVITLSPTSAAPPWFYGIFFILIFAALLKMLPFGGMVDSPPPANPVDFALSVLKHLILPASALIISSLFLSIYNWRTFFLIYSSEDYVEMAKAKGLPARDVERRYILRPTLPTIITNFALLLISTVDRRHHHRDGLPVARAGTNAVSGHRPVRHPGDRRLDDHLCVPAGDHRLPAGFCLRAG